MKGEEGETAGAASVLGAAIRFVGYCGENLAISNPDPGGGKDAAFDVGRKGFRLGSRELFIFFREQRR
ncbi:MAG: hypothetical protein GTO29_10735 [Candidatus Latescibacteria bacterium]|nr:hypothetical protein [Candidatus Latescibacterota bacterium]NIO56637.1 hypothetical protein [Candidatus Latescibacterota bacterium]